MYLLLAAPIGALADRVGRATVIVAGYVGLFAVYLALSSSLPATAVGQAIFDENDSRLRFDQRDFIVTRQRVPGKRDRRRAGSGGQRQVQR